MKTRTTLILVGLFLALAAYVYFFELRTGNEPVATATPGPQALWDVSSDQVTGLTVQSGEQEVRLTRAPESDWVLEAPTSEPADQGRVSQVVERLTNLTPSRTLTDTLSPMEDYGLNEPSMEVTLTLSDGQSRVLIVGAANPQQTSYYALQGEDETAVHLIPSWLVTTLQQLLETPPLQPTPTAQPTSTPEA